MKRMISLILVFATLLSLLTIPQAALAEGQTKWLHGIPNFKQYDSQWKNTKIGTKTIGDVGCLVTSMAMSESYRQGKTINPATMRNQLSFSNNDMYWPSNYSTIGSGVNLQLIYNTINAGKPVIVGAKNSSGGWHWVIVTGYVNLNTSNMQRSCFQINDPNSTSRTNLSQFLSVYPNSVTLKTYNGAGKDTSTSSTSSSTNTSRSRITITSLIGSKTCRGYLCVSSNQKVYPNSSLSGHDGSWVYTNDYIRIVNVSGNSLLIEYPAGSGVKQKWVSADKIFVNFSYGVWSKTATQNINVTSRPGGGVKVGTVYRGDLTYVLGENGSYYQILYPAGSVWKFGFVPKGQL